MAQDKSKDTSVVDELDAEDELDGWGPVRVRRSTLPSAPPPEVTAKPSESDAANQGEGGETKTLIS